MTYHAAYEPQRAVRTSRYKYMRRYDEQHPGRVLANLDDSLTKDALLAAGWADVPPAVGGTLRPVARSLRREQPHRRSGIVVGRRRPPGAAARLDGADRGPADGGTCTPGRGHVRQLLSTRCRPATPPLRLRPAAPHTRNGLGTEMHGRTEQRPSEPVSAVAWFEAVFVDLPGRTVTARRTSVWQTPMAGLLAIQAPVRPGWQSLLMDHMALARRRGQVAHRNRQCVATDAMAIRETHPPLLR